MKLFKTLFCTVSIAFLYSYSFAQNADIVKSDALSAEAKEEYAKAAKFYEEAIVAYEKQNSTDTFCVYHAGSNYYKIEQYEKAISFLQKAVSLNYNTESSVKLIADCYIKLKQNDKAKDILLSAKDSFPESSYEFEKKLGYIYFNSGDYENASKIFKTINEQEPGKKTYLYMLGFSLERLKKYEEALGILKELRSSYPDYSNGNKIYGITLFEYADSKNKAAVNHYNSIKQQDLDDYIATKKRLDKIDNIYEEARVVLEKEYANNPSDKHIIGVLYNIYKKQGKTTNAAEMQKLL